MNLILSTPSIEYAKAVSHELWMLARPRGFSDNETSQYYCGTFAHPDGTKVAIGPIELSTVKASINPNMLGNEILLGMSFLKHLELLQRGDKLTLRQYP